jgi:hypothetical protein
VAEDRSSDASWWERVVPGRMKARALESARKALISDLEDALEDAAHQRSDFSMGWGGSHLSEEDHALDLGALAARVEEARAAALTEVQAREFRDRQGRARVEGVLKALEDLSDLEVGPELLERLSRAALEFAKLESFERAGLRAYLVRPDAERAEELVAREVKRLREDPTSRELVLRGRLRGEAKGGTPASAALLEASLDAFVADLVVLKVRTRAQGVHSRVLELRPGVVLCARAEALGGLEFDDWVEVGDLIEEELETFLVLVADSHDTALAELKESALALSA